MKFGLTIKKKRKFDISTAHKATIHTITNISAVFKYDKKLIIEAYKVATIPHGSHVLAVLYCNKVRNAKAAHVIKRLWRKELEILESVYDKRTVLKYVAIYRNYAKEILQYNELQLTVIVNNANTKNFVSKANDRGLYERIEQVESNEAIELTKMFDFAANTLKTSKDYKELILSVAALTGRRVCEIVKSGNFKTSKHGKNYIEFSGQLKTKGEHENDIFTIPAFCDSQLIIKSIEKIRKSGNVKRYINEAENMERLNAFVTKSLNATFKREFASFAPKTPHQLRAAYAAALVELHTAKGRGKSSLITSFSGSSIMVVSKALGHGLGEKSAKNLSSANFYERFKPDSKEAMRIIKYFKKINKEAIK